MLDIRFLPTFRAPMRELAHFFSGRGIVALTRNELIWRGIGFQGRSSATATSRNVGKYTQCDMKGEVHFDSQRGYHATISESNKLMALV